MQWKIYQGESRVIWQCKQHRGLVRKSFNLGNGFEEERINVAHSCQFSLPTRIFVFPGMETGALNRRSIHVSISFTSCATRLDVHSLTCPVKTPHTVSLGSGKLMKTLDVLSIGLPGCSARGSCTFSTWSFVAGIDDSLQGGQTFAKTGEKRVVTDQTDRGQGVVSQTTFPFPFIILRTICTEQFMSD